MEGQIRILIAGAGNWGSTFAKVLGDNGVDCDLWFRDQSLCQETSLSRINKAYLPDILIPDRVHMISVISEPEKYDLVVLAIPANSIRAFLQDFEPRFHKGAGFLSLAKGLEMSSGKRVSEVMREVLGPTRLISCLSGPNIAREIALQKPAIAVVASDDAEHSRSLQHLISSPSFRVYTNSDLIGVEISGALKNVIAIAAGICQELELGDNALAALITRGIAEIARYGSACGANPLTFMGMAGVGDLAVTCMSRQSRNNRLGHELARGSTLDEAVAKSRMVVEGVSTAKIIVQKAQTLGVYMPICQAVHDILFAAIPVTEAISSLMQNHLRMEMDL